ncbi:MAG: hypothetical protein K2J40_02955 [Ruminococcus sp.]|nr:hypothetical protein [Ruminococcus sp.]
MILAESKNYIVYNDYEIVLLKNKSDGSEIIIGDFYGDPCGALIDTEEKFILMYGCGVIIYYLPAYEEYQYNIKTPQWDEFSRENPVMWVENAVQTDRNEVKLTLEDGTSKIIKTDIHF